MIFKIYESRWVPAGLNKSSFGTISTINEVFSTWVHLVARTMLLLFNCPKYCSKAVSWPIVFFCKNAENLCTVSRSCHEWRVSSKLNFGFCLTDKGEDSRLVHRRKRSKEKAAPSRYFLLFFAEASERRVWLSAESKILASTFGRFRLYRLTANNFKRITNVNRKF